MALPTSRNKTYAAGDPVRAADLNDLQDQIIALQAEIAALGGGTRTSRVSGGIGAGFTGAAANDGADATLSTIGDTVVWDVPFPYGGRLLEVRAGVDAPASGNLRLDVNVNGASVAHDDSSGSGSQILSVTVSEVHGASNRLLLVLTLQGASSSASCSSLEIDWDYPP